MKRTEKVHTEDGDFDLSLWLPDGGSGHAVLILQEIFGVGEYIEAVAGDLNRLGYVAAAPDLFWRVHPHWRAGHDERGVHESMAVAGEFDPEQGVADALTALRHLAALPEVDGVSVLGFCLGGSLAFRLAAQTDEPAAVLSFYGSQVPDHLTLVDRITVPLQLHFGGQDPYIPAGKVAAVADAVAGRDNVELHIQQDAGHAFHNRVAPMFYQPEAADRAWRLAAEFLARHTARS